MTSYIMSPTSFSQANLPSCHCLAIILKLLRYNTYEAERIKLPIRSKETGEAFPEIHTIAKYFTDVK